MLLEADSFGGRPCSDRGRIQRVLAVHLRRRLETVGLRIQRGLLQVKHHGEPHRASLPHLYLPLLRSGDREAPATGGGPRVAVMNLRRLRVVRPVRLIRHGD